MTEPETDPSRLAEMAERLRPLARPLPRAKPGDWLAEHPESGQTYDEYIRSSPNRPTDRRKAMYVLPVGELSGAERSLVEATVLLLGIFYNLPVTLLRPVSVRSFPASARRKNPNDGRTQLLTSHILKLSRTLSPPDAAATLALTAVDLWPGQNWNFVFGQASYQDRVGVWSFARFGDAKTEFDLCLRRTLKTAVHETGHIFGIRHCTAYLCGMNGSNHLEEADSQPMGFCPVDERKVWWCCRADPVGRADRLVKFAVDWGLEDEAREWRRSLEALKGAAPSAKPRSTHDP
ncbi:MAG: archaemetzincin [Isosphaeraceae bacterium]